MKMSFLVILQCTHTSTINSFLHIVSAWNIMFVLGDFRPSQPNGVMSARSVYLTTLLQGRLSPLSG